jgi:hypothetical protein
LVRLEVAGIPTVLVTTTEFNRLTVQVLAALGLPRARIATVEHPLGGIAPDGARARGGLIVEEVQRLWTSEY